MKLEIVCHFVVLDGGIGFGDKNGILRIFLTSTFKYNCYKMRLSSHPTLRCISKLQPSISSRRIRGEYSNPILPSFFESLRLSSTLELTFDLTSFYLSTPTFPIWLSLYWIGLHSTSPNRVISKFTMPAMSPTMTEGGIAAWKVKDGQSFSAGDVLLEIVSIKLLSKSSEIWAGHGEKGGGTEREWELVGKDWKIRSKLDFTRILKDPTSSEIFWFL